VIRFVLLLYDSCCYEFLAYTSYSSELGKYLKDFAMEFSFPQLKLSCATFGMEFSLATDFVRRYLINGRNANRPSGIRVGEFVVLKLCEPYLHCRRNITTDNLFIVSFSHQQTLNLGIPQTENALSTGINAIEHLHKYTFRMNFHDN
uniref:Uncharacterized protein n=2 Tax=Glossina palpalis gambiensis TaxID=67801 RepID=A0A1B0BF88_9MUSC